ncbi:hypothetical protein Ocin01_08145 [Orchesella cincta]|uniref:Uncharacterized protein n=1 Tax=Orchesella cincta TaxID=48709 RepID=A0A1D2MZS5_ORCCI|nr:hypothetical protein Ocin01_08145 [Orchesella cincta]
MATISPNPCPCTSLQNGVKAVAVVEAVIHVWFVYRYAKAVKTINDWAESPLPLARETAKTWDPYIPFIVGWLVINCFRVILALVLFFGALKKLSPLIWTWFGFTSLFLFLSVIYLILMIASTISGLTYYIIEVGFLIVVDIYFLYVVFAFLAQLRKQGQPMSAYHGGPNEASSHGKGQSTGQWMTERTMPLNNLSSHLNLSSSAFPLLPDPLFSRIRLICSSVKMVPNPCPNGSLQGWSKAIAVILFVWWISIAFVCVQTLENIFEEDEEYPDASPNIFIAIPILATVFAIIRVLVAPILVIGAWKKITACCWIWVGVMTVLLIFDLIPVFFILVWVWVSGIEQSSFKTAVMLVMASILAIQAYLIYVVYAFIMEMRAEKQQQQRVSPEEVGSNVVGVGAAPQPQQAMNLEAADQPILSTEAPTRRDNHLPPQNGSKSLLLRLFAVNLSLPADCGDDRRIDICRGGLSSECSRKIESYEIIIDSYHTSKLDKNTFNFHLNISAPLYEQLKANKPLYTFGLIVAVIRILAGVVLALGAWRKHITCCRTWVGVSTGLLVFFLVQFIILLTNGSEHSDMTSIALVSCVFGFLFRCYPIYVVHSFIKQLREEEKKEIPGAIRGAPSQPIYRAMDRSTFNAAEEQLDEPPELSSQTESSHPNLSFSAFPLLPGQSFHRFCSVPSTRSNVDESESPSWLKTLVNPESVFAPRVTMVVNVPNPCSGGSLQTWSKVIAIIEMVLYLLGIGLQIWAIQLLKAAKESKVGQFGDAYYDALITESLWHSVLLDLDRSFGVRLSYGVISLLILWSAPTKTDMKMPGAMAGGNIAMAIGYLIQFYLIYVVFAFVMEMRNEKQQQQVAPVAGAYPVGVPSLRLLIMSPPPTTNSTTQLRFSIKSAYFYL